MSNSETDLDTLVNNYDTTLHDIINNHAPLKQRTVTIRPSKPWYSPEIDKAKKLRKQLERRWRKSKLEIDRQLFKSQRLVVINMINQAKSEYYENQYHNVKIKRLFLKSSRISCIRKAMLNCPLMLVRRNLHIGLMISSLLRFQKFEKILMQLFHLHLASLT